LGTPSAHWSLVIPNGIRAFAISLTADRSATNPSRSFTKRRAFDRVVGFCALVGG
jgi:hypothetical protein